ncbi:lipoprotein [Thiotrichales bacterium 19S9-12]|nr:lipoprotein [Thiotrichales bacterium 19S9-11]MCF6811138.1 lipoprotein [Thiotrichales bacterium 19S9-12]
MSQFFKFICLSVISIHLTACGQIGPLYLPKDKKTPQDVEQQKKPSITNSEASEK